MPRPEDVTTEQKKFEGLLRYYQERVTTSVCNRTKLRAAVDDLVSFLLETVNNLRARLELREEEIAKLQAPPQVLFIPPGGEAPKVINPGPMFTAATTNGADTKGA